MGTGLPTGKYGRIFGLHSHNLYLRVIGFQGCTSQAVTTCQIYMRKSKDGATITIEPWRSAAFPVIKDLVVNRSSYDQILQAGGFISVRTNSVPDGNAIPIPKADADESTGFYGVEHYSSSVFDPEGNVIELVA